MWRSHCQNETHCQNEKEVGKYGSMCNKNEKQREELSAGTGIAEERFD